ncbi:MAG TPA: S41 family peptidase [Longimicrobiales bacterium]
MKIKRSILAPLLVAALALASGGWLLQKGASQEQNVYFQARLFEEVLHHVSDRFVEPKDPAALYRMAIDGLLHELGDPHTSLMTPQDYERLRVQTQGEYGGLGIQIDIRDGWVTVIAPLRDTPAERAGLQAGDRIVEVDGKSTRGWTVDEAVERLRGPKGQPVDLRVARSGVDEPIPFRIVRDEIRVPSVPSAYMLDDRVGYVELRVFSETSAQDLKEAIDGLRAKGMKGLVLDLRQNPGGLLDQGVAVSDLFLEEGRAVVETRSRIPSQNQDFVATSRDEYPGMPIVVLVDEGSASASEIVAGALQDNDRALVVGRTTFGKGSVQTLFPLSGGNHLKLTTARWYTASGRSIQKPYNGAAMNGVAGATDAASGDSTGVGTREAFRTVGGRVVYGGGGIRPDVIMERDTLSTAEQTFLRSLQRHGSKYRDAVFRYAVEYARAHPDLEPDFAVTPAMLDGLYAALREAGIDVERSEFDQASRWVGRDLAVEITHAKWGDAEARRRWNATDPWIEVARDLLRQARNMDELFAAGARYAEAHEVGPEPQQEEQGAEQELEGALR